MNSNENSKNINTPKNGGEDLGIPQTPVEDPVSNLGLEHLLSFPNEDVKKKLKGEDSEDGSKD